MAPAALRLAKIILVDHHTASENIDADNIMEIMDHRPVTQPLPPNAKCTIDDVGSCATLIADTILRSGAAPECKDILQLLHGAIVLDTVNFSKEADKTRPLDVSVNASIEQLLGCDKDQRNRLFADLVVARSDVSSLDSLQILSKDLKIITNAAKTLRVAIPGYPILVQVKFHCL